jgi:hypothetical protein
MDSCGVVVGANQHSAWLLPWWWKHYVQHNSLPVTFVDFGLSDGAVAWCQERGDVVSLDPAQISIASREEVSPALRDEWEEKWGKEIWVSRQGWFCKPSACLLSPYDVSIWLDLDCEVCGSLQGVLDAFNPRLEMAASTFPQLKSSYSSGMLVFRRNARLLQDWAIKSPAQSAVMFSDDNVLTSLIHTKQYAVEELSCISHCIGLTGIDPSALVLHWDGKAGKLFIETHGGYQDYRAFLLGKTHE